MKALVTGGNGFLGRLFVPELVKRGFDVVSVDVRDAEPLDVKASFVRADAADYDALARAAGNGVGVVFHLASQIDFAVDSQRALYENNVAVARAVARLAREKRIPKVVFTSSNSVYLGNRRDRPILEADPPIPHDEYGFSKIESERIFAEHASTFDTVTIRSPNIMSAGRVGMLSILFDFVREGRRCWVLGEGNVRHQCIYADDLMDALLKAASFQGSETFNIGSDNVPSVREMYERLVERAGTNAKVVSIPAALALPPLRMAHKLGISPLGEYQFRMLTQDFVFDTGKIKRLLKWAPTVDNSEMLYKAYEHYQAHHDEIVAAQNLSANRQAITKLGVIGMLKLIS